MLKLSGVRPTEMIEELTIGEFYSNETIFTALKVGNAGGIRLSLLEKSVSRVAIMASVQDTRITSETHITTDLRMESSPIQRQAKLVNRR